MRFLKPVNTQLPKQVAQKQEKGTMIEFHRKRKLIQKVGALCKLIELVGKTQTNSH